MNQNSNQAVVSREDRIAGALLGIIESPEWDRRSLRRIPYFGPVSLRLEGADSARLSAFARDLSTGGIGLVHLMPLENTEVVITLKLPSGQPIELLTQIRWCRSFGDGWYASGGEFLDVVE